MDPHLMALFPSVAGPAGPLPAPMRVRVRHTLEACGVRTESRETTSDEVSSIGCVRRELRGDAFTETSLPHAAVGVDDYLRRVAHEVVEGAVDMFSPRCLGHMTSVVPAFARSVSQVVDDLNQNLVKTEASPTLTMLERQTLAMLHRLVFDQPAALYAAHVQDPDSTFGIMTGGATIANITALWIARNAVLSHEHPGSPADGSALLVEEAGLAAALARSGHDGVAIIGSDSMHYSIEKAVALLGLGARSLLRVRTDREQRIDLAALRRVVDECHERRRRIIAIVGVAGSTDCGSIDPLAELAAIAARAGAHFHVDAAWGGPLLFSKRHAAKLRGIERADSVSFDGHKQMYLPVGTGMLLLRDRRAARLIEKHARYMLQEGSGDLGRRSLEGSRDGAALFVHAALHVIGADGYGAMIDGNFRTARRMADMLRARDDFELLHDPQMNIVLYRYVPAPLRAALIAGRLTAADHERINLVNERLQQLQYSAGRSYVSRTTLDASHGSDRSARIVALRAVVANPFTTEADVLAVIEEQGAIGASQSGA